MVRIATRNEKPSQRVRYRHSSGLRAMSIQVPQRGADVPAGLHGTGELPR
jgi:hypothetical protein